MKKKQIVLSMSEAIGLIIAAAIILGIVTYNEILGLEISYGNGMFIFSGWIVIRLTYFTVKNWNVVIE